MTDATGAAVCLVRLPATAFGDVPAMIFSCIAATNDVSNTMVDVRCGAVGARMAGIGDATEAARASDLLTGGGEKAKPSGEKNAA